MFGQFFLSLQVRGCAIISYKDGIYELPQELQNDLRLRMLRIENIKKVSKSHRMIAQCPVLLLKRKFCQYQQRTVEIKRFPYCAISHGNQSQSQIFCEWLSLKSVFCLQLRPGRFKHNFFDLFGNSNAFHTILT